MKAMLEDIWKNSTTSPTVTLDSILNVGLTRIDPSDPVPQNLIEAPQITFPTHCSAQAIIHAPSHLSIPDMLINLMHFGEPTFEKGNWMSISLWLKTQKGYAFVPTVVVVSRGRKDKTALKIENTNKALFASTPAEKMYSASKSTSSRSGSRATLSSQAGPFPSQFSLRTLSSPFISPI